MIVYLVRVLADLTYLFLVFLAGLVIGYLLRGPPSASVTYSNMEEWEIIKDEDGRVRGIKVHRRAEAS